MDSNNKLYGAWIFPNNKIYYTNVIESHTKIINDLNIKSYLIDQSKQIKWTDDELKTFKKNDLSYVALKIGFIRILSFNTELAIESIQNIYSRKTIILEAIKNIEKYKQCKFSEFIIENPFTCKYTKIKIQDFKTTILGDNIL